jgi:hypothetical protein
MTLAELSTRTAVREAYLAAIEADREEPSAAALGRLVRELDPSGAAYAQLAGLLTAPDLDPSGEYAHLNEPRAGTSPSTRGDAGHRAQGAHEELQFDVAVTDIPGVTGTPGVAVRCEACRQLIETEYFDVNAKVMCGRCRAEAEAAAEVPPGILPLVIAGAFGLGAALAGAAIYYAILAIAHLQIGYVAILIGYMVGYSVRRGARGRGGLRFQIVALSLTYASIAFAYTPIAVGAAVRGAQEARAAANGSRPAPVRPIAKPTIGQAAVAVLILLTLIAALPLMVIAGSFPSGLITAFIIFIGLRQAWKMTAAVTILVLGPYRVGSAALSPQI